MTSRPIVVIFGSGANIGAAVTKKFVEAGYRVCCVSRSAPAMPSDDGNVLSVQADLSKPAEVPPVFQIIKSHWGSDAFPHIIIWNAGRRTSTPDKSNLFSVPTEDLITDFTIANAAPWAAANEAIKHWTSNVRGVFIYNGNIMGKAVFPHPDYTTLGVGKRAAAYWLDAADATYKQKGWRFYFADERTPEGRPVGSVPGAESHARMFLELAKGEKNEKLPWYLTFSQGEYKEF
ncbi:short-chain dehydrogenase/reductase SDR [Xylogone sp. PMI_703]|nr:short-chain dehydrogenase/reductase SDR [Xylogone sp. PMI_703]